MNLQNHFGVNVLAEFDRWFHDEFTPEFHRTYGEEAHISLIILDPDFTLSALLHWQDPFKHKMVHEWIGDGELATKAGGTDANVAGKLRFVLRTLEDSVRAESLFSSVRPGDFPWEGSGVGGDYLEYVGGVSGLAKEDDWKVFCQCVDKLDELLALVGKAATELTQQYRDQPNWPQVKYLNVELEANFFDQLREWATAESGMTSNQLGNS